MKITNLKTIHLNNLEVKNAIVAWLGKNLPYDNLAFTLLLNNNFILNFKNDGGLSIVIYAEIEEYNSEKK